MTPANQPTALPDEDSGIVSHVVVSDPQAHRELAELCLKWHRKKKNSMFIDREQSLYSYRKEGAANAR